MKKCHAFTFTEILITVAVIGLLASIAVLAVGTAVNSTQEHKLESDVATLNRAVVAHIASGGDLSDASDAAAIIDTLKKSPESNRVPGLTGAKLDSSVSAVMQSPSEASSSSPRVYWNAERQRFYIATRGNEPGIKAFRYDRDLAEIDFGSAENQSSLLYAENGEWIWDYVEVPVTAPPGASEVPLGDPVSSSPPASPPAASPPSPTSVTTLDPPGFSVPGGDYPISDFALTVALTNPNPLGSSEIYYSVDYGEWRRYDGPFNVSPDTNVAAQVIAVVKEYDNSDRIDHAYQALPSALAPPVIEATRDMLGIFTERQSTISISNPNATSVSSIEYRIGSGSWQEYLAPFDVSRDDYPLGLRIEARAIPTGEYYTQSDDATRSVEVEPIRITGFGAGQFQNPRGPSGMVTNLSGGSTSDYFEWGRDEFTASELASFGSRPVPKLAKSWMKYDATAFDSVSTMTPFRIGALTYYNGTIVSGTDAVAVEFRVNLDLEIQGRRLAVPFHFEFELINNIIRGIDPWEDADYVRISSNLAKETIEIDGVHFQLQIEFGESTAAGFSDFNEFHVLEDHQASTGIYATLVEVGSSVTVPASSSSAP